MFVTLPSATPLSAFDWFQRRVFAQRAEMNTLVKCKPCLDEFGWRNWRNVKNLQRMHFLEKKKNWHLLWLDPAELWGEMWTEEGSFGSVDFTGIRSLWDGLVEPAEWLLKYQRKVSCQQHGWLQMLTHPQTVLTLPLSYHLCPSVLVPHCDHARRWGQTISVKEKKNIFEMSVCPCEFDLNL